MPITIFFQQFGIKIPTVSFTNYKFLLAEHGIKSLSSILIRLPSDSGHDWDNFLRVSKLNYNSYSSFNMVGLSLGHKAKICSFIEVSPEVVVTNPFKIYHLMVKKLAYLRKHLHKFRN